jgi:hypothetical protein
MKKKGFCILFLTFSLYQIFSQEYFIKKNDINLSKYDYDYEFTQYGLRALGELSARLFFPSDSNSLTFVNFGLGVGVDIYPHVLSPGIYLDIGIGTDWFALFSKDDDKDKKEDKDTKDKKEDDEDIPQIGLNAGLRIYNIINIHYFNIIPFIGYNVVLGHYPLPNAGISISFKIFAIEYAYYFPVSYDPIGHHHFAVKISINDYWGNVF